MAVAMVVMVVMVVAVISLMTLTVIAAAAKAASVLIVSHVLTSIKIAPRSSWELPKPRLTPALYGTHSLCRRNIYYVILFAIQLGSGFYQRQAISGSSRDDHAIASG